MPNSALRCSLLLLPLTWFSCSTPAQKVEKPDALKEAVRKYEARIAQLEAAMRRTKKAAKTTPDPVEAQRGGTQRSQGKQDPKTRRAIREIQQELAKARAANRKLAADLLSVTNSFQSAMKSARSQTNIEQKRSHQLAQEVGKLKQNAAKAEQTKSAIAERANKLEIALIQQRRKLAESEKRAASMVTAQAEDRKQHKIAVTHNQELKKRYATAQIRLNEAQTMLAKLQATVNDRTSKAKAAKNRAEQLAAENQRLTQASNQTHAKAASFRKHFGTLTAESKRAADRAKAAIARADQLAEENRRLTQASKRTRDEAASILEQTASLTAASKKASEKARAASARAEQLAEENRKLRELSEGARVAAEKFRKQYTNLKTVSSKVESRAGKLLAETSRLQKSNADLRAKIRAQENREKYFTQSAAVAKRAKERAEDLVVQNRQLAARARAAQDQLAQQEAALAAMREQVADLTREASARRLTAPEAQRQPPTAAPKAPTTDEGIRIYNQGGTVIIDRRQRFTTPPATGTKSERKRPDQRPRRPGRLPEARPALDRPTKREVDPKPPRRRINF